MNKYAVVGLGAAVVVVLDQATKWLITNNFTLHESVPIIDSLFHITYVRNRGGAFSLLSDLPDSIRLPFFISAFFVAFGALVYFVRGVEPHQRILQLALAGILGGALGNFIDRASVGTVVDFLDVHWRDYYWPAFNVADSFISIGTVIILLESFRGGSSPTGRGQVRG